MPDALAYAAELVSFDSVSRVSNLAVSACVETSLRRLGFETERVEFTDEQNVPKVSIVGRKGAGSGGFAYFAHTDVVPADTWVFPDHGPFTPTQKDGRLYGRGACDMKGSIACMLAAMERISRPLRAPVYITCTADEEVGYNGAREVVARSRLYREMVAGQPRSIIGEPTRLEVVHAHKGTFGFIATARGKAAHSSTSFGLNANLAMIPFLVEMKQIHDELEENPKYHNSEFDPPTMSWNIGINDHTKALNITAPQSVCTVYFRPTPGQDGPALMERAKSLAARYGLDFKPLWQAPPMYVDPQSLWIQELLGVVGQKSSRTVAYGTDGALFGELRQLAVCGPGDIAQAHTHDEWIALEQLEIGTQLYTRCVEEWCC